MNPQLLLNQAKQLGIKVEVFDGKLSVVRQPGRSPEFVELLRQHKTELLAWFAADHLIRQIRAGEFAGCDRRTAKRIISILKTSGHPLARPSLQHLLNHA